jgi:hypothetical protein
LYSGRDEGEIFGEDFEQLKVLLTEIPEDETYYIVMRMILPMALACHLEIRKVTIAW